jgi:uncharacterized protein YeeX (DUF496 family)
MQAKQRLFQTNKIINDNIKRVELYTQATHYVKT